MLMKQVTAIGRHHQIPPTTIRRILTVIVTISPHEAEEGRENTRRFTDRKLARTNLVSMQWSIHQRVHRILPMMTR